MAIKLGSLSISKVYKGSTEITDIYKGSDKVYSSEEPIVPRYVIVGAYGKTYNSLDGINWSSGGDAGSSTIYAIAYGNGLYVCFNYDKKSYYSTDGINWNMGSSFSNVITKLCYANGRFVGVGWGGYSVYSTDGINWNSMSNSGSTSFLGLKYCNNRFIAVGYSGKSCYSTNGTSWVTMSGIGSSYDVYDVCYGNNKYVCVTGNKAFVSTNGESWESSYTVSSASGLYLYSIDWSRVNFCTAGWDGYVYTSSGSDVSRWNQQTGFDSTYYKIKYLNTKLYALGGDYVTKRLLYSVYGYGFTATSFTPSGMVNDITYGG